ncbi:MAG: biotin--[acetyl-CoA-carboxylase] ligase [Dehalococcoidales bacterium]|nr:biotin--[acetyl-CoA-carboxylase] ligase [Dehalococcoidales bacterium]
MIIKIFRMRELILNILQQEKHISGENLGKRLNISRTAVWKHINELRRRGYKIESSPRSGYSFIKNTSLLLPEEISPGLQTSVMGKHIKYYREISSTQDIAARMAHEGAAEGTIVIAETQSKGRGRMGRQWVSPFEGGIYLSLILRPKLLPSQIMQIPLIAGLALARAITHILPLQPAIKWPNDITIGRKKVAGILTEMSSEIDGVNYIILGVGINVNTPATLLAEQTAGIGTSFIGECGKYTSRVRLVQSFLNEFELIYQKYLDSGFGSIRKDWQVYDTTIGARVRVKSGNRNIEGRAIDIDDNGFLLVKTDKGSINRIINGDVFIIDPAGLN